LNFVSYGKLRFEHLRIFISLLQIGSFSECAKIIGKSQGTISNIVNDIEESLGGVCLIHRNAKNFEVTEAGRAFAAYAQEILNRTEEMYTKLKTAESSKPYQIHIASSSIPGEFILPRFIMEFTKDRNDIKINLDIGNSLSAINLLLNGKVNFVAIGGFLTYDTNYFDMVEIGQDRIELVTSKKSPLILEFKNLSKDASLEQIIGLISKYKLIIREKGSATRDEFMKKFPKAKDLKIEMEFTNNISLIQTLLTTNAVSIVSSLFLEKSLFGDLLAELKHPNLPEIRRSFYLIKMKGRELPKIEEEFWNFNLKNI
jgi:DNA-binding transcriptional LysR family regulator